MTGMHHRPFHRRLLLLAGRPEFLVAGVDAWGLAVMWRGGWHGIVGVTAACQRRPGTGARGAIHVAEENVMDRKAPQAESPPARTCHEAIDHHDPVHEWRVWQLSRLGIPWSLAQTVAGQVDWHQVARLVQHGCPPRLALSIVC